MGYKYIHKIEYWDIRAITWLFPIFFLYKISLIIRTNQESMLEGNNANLCIYKTHENYNTFKFSFYEKQLIN